MISAKPMAMVPVLALAGVAAAQEKVDEQWIAELIEQLGDADQLKRDTAVHQLADQGRPAAPNVGSEARANSRASSPRYRAE